MSLPIDSVLPASHWNDNASFMEYHTDLLARVLATSQAPEDADVQVAVILIDNLCPHSKRVAEDRLGISFKTVPSGTTSVLDVRKLHRETESGWLHPYLRNMYCSWLKGSEFLAISVTKGEIAYAHCKLVEPTITEQNVKAVILYWFSVNWSNA